ncbi:MAG: hypothetical protein DWQ04_16680 [Chloroflexi bacterium]|nr:MAG: hypothetical protein DWQ04_16680 [Chloroflexota bacterium]
MLFVLPESNNGLKGLDLVRLRRFADWRRIEIGLVSADGGMRRQALALGIPAFKDEQGAHNRRGWWRGRRRDERVGLPTTGAGSISEQSQQIAVTNKLAAHLQPRVWAVSPRQWLVRYVGILLFCVAVALLVVSFIYFVPTATITLHPETMDLHVEQPVVADPNLAAIDYQNKIVPGRNLLVEMVWDAELDTTGAVDVPNAPARGAVVFTNLTETAVTLPAGTQVSTADDPAILFQTLSTVTIPEVEGGTAEVEVVAVDPGPQGNVAAEQIVRVNGTFTEQVSVRNVSAMSGGAFRQEAVVNEADMARLRSQVVQFLQALAASELEAQLTEDEFLARDSLRIAVILDETYSHAVGELTESLSLEIRAALVGTAVNTTQASGLVYDILIRDVPFDHTVVPDSIHFTAGDVIGTDDAGRVTFVMQADGVAAVDVAQSTPTSAITGQDADLAIAYLNKSLPLQQLPLIDIWPVWFDRVPYAASRIEVEVVTR